MDSTWFEKQERRAAADSAFAQRVLFHAVVLVAALGFLVLVS